MPLPLRRHVSLRIIPWLGFVLGGCSLLDFRELSSQYSSTAGNGPNGGEPTTGGASGEGGDGGQGGNRGGSGNQGGEDTGGGGAGGLGGGGNGGDGATGGEPNVPVDGGSAGVDGGPAEVPRACDNARRDNEETDTDCGGGACPRCVDGDTCGIDNDCVSRRCQGGRCEPPTCDDNRKNGNESDMDCGGPDDCAPCQVGDRCELRRDCEIPLNSKNLCTVENVCDSECLGTFLDCDAAKGCEVDPSDDVDHCGDCDTECSDTNGTPDCNSGSCEIACDTGFDDCTGGVADGCETNIFTSEEHCGACNAAACADECVDGECCVGLAPNVNRAMTSCFTVDPEPACDSITIQKQDPGSVTYTTTSTCNTAGGALAGNGASVNLAVCRTTFHLAAAANMRWWKTGCD